MNNTNLIGFPNLGLGPWEINKFIFNTGTFRVAWYGLIITIGIVFAVWYAMHRSKQEGFTKDDVLDYAIWVVLIGILGARLYYVAMTWGNYTSLLDLVAVWRGGLAIYGGLIAGGLTVLLLSLKKGKNPLKFLDMTVPGVMVAQAIGRWGNFFNGEAYGSILKYEFLGKTFEMTRSKGQAIKWIMTIQTDADAIKTYAHPTFLYESLWNLIGFFLLNHIYVKNKKKFDGQIFFGYVIWYGFGRMFIEGFRTDALYLGNVRISQLVALGCVIFGIMFYNLLKKRAKPVRQAVADSASYETLFTAKEEEDKVEERIEAVREESAQMTADKLRRNAEQQQKEQTDTEKNEETK